MMYTDLFDEINKELNWIFQATSVCLRAPVSESLQTSQYGVI